MVRFNQVNIVLLSWTVGSNNILNTYYTQLGVVLEATSYIETMLPYIQISPWKIHIMIVVRNSAALQLLTKPHL